MEKKDLICIGCPLGCAITVMTDQEKVINITGHTCKRGEEYARKEVQNPTRIVTSVVCVESRTEKMLPVKTKRDIPKGKIFDVMEQLRTVRVKAPVGIGDTVLEDAAHTGVSVVATKEIPE